MMSVVNRADRQARGWDLLVPWLLLVALGAAPNRAAAFSDPTGFAENVMVGGGGVKFFTGSHAEGYTCNVCHAGGTPPDVTVFGLPLAGYVPSQVYPITIDWPDTLSGVSFNLEMTDALGDRFGEIDVIDPTLLSPPDLCAGGEVSSGASTVNLSNGRRILTVARCGQHQTTFQWQAPGRLAQGWLSASLVSADRKKDVLGDGVTNISHVLGVQGAPAPAAGDLAAPASCGVARGTRHTTHVLSWLLIAMTWLRLRRRG
jgi:hypothetical protein